MAQKFSSIDEAASLLGITKERLNQIREAGKVRAYRDGASWKFRQDDIEKLIETGIPSIEPGASDINLDLGDLQSPIGGTAEPSAMDLELADDLQVGPASDLNLDDVDEPTLPAVGDGDLDDLALDLDSESVDMSDSILLSEAELGGSSSRPPSTIIGRAELDADLDLSPKPKDEAASLSDVSLAPPSDIISADDDLALDMEPPSPSDNFQGLEELEIDLEAESSRILAPEDVAKAQSAAKQAKASQLSDLELAPSDSDVAAAASDVDLGGSVVGGALGLTGLSALELDDEGDQVLGEGSDVTLSSESSGINIISPSDSGLALDEVPLDLSGSAAMGSSLDLGGALEEDVELEPLAIGAAGESGVGEPFQLTPLGDDAGDDEKDSSQVIALDEISEESAGEPFAVGAGDAGDIGEDFGSVGLAPGAVVVDSGAETPFSGWVVAGLSTCLVMLALCGMMVFDLVRNIWSWDGVASLNSSLLEVINPLL